MPEAAVAVSTNLLNAMPNISEHYTALSHHPLRRRFINLANQKPAEQGLNYDIDEITVCIR
ncbi:hypothetical protein LZK74_02720 [Sinorhizobium meliloti]|nr:hypothetical protein LZK74_02720 [Sinorhizobium meliloti]